MPVWLLALLPKLIDAAASLALQYVLPHVITYLRTNGHINAAEELAARGAVAIVKDVRDTKTYAEYPEQKDKFGSTTQPPASTNLKS